MFHMEHTYTLIKETLNIPKDYQFALVPGSATGAMESALWNLMGPHPVKAYVWDVFSQYWYEDVAHHLNLTTQRIDLTPLEQNPVPLITPCATHDILITWCGTTSGLWLRPEHHPRALGDNLVFCDATSIVFAKNLPWSDLDVIAFSFQKALGAEAGLGGLILSPKALKRLHTWTPAWAMPRILRLKHRGKVLEQVFQGGTLNTVSMLLMQELDMALTLWKNNGGYTHAAATLQANYDQVCQWLKHEPMMTFQVAQEPDRSLTALCLTPAHFSCDITKAQKWAFLHQVQTLLRDHKVGYDILNHALGPPCFRIWCGPTQRPQDLRDFLPWLSWAIRAIHTL